MFFGKARQTIKRVLIVEDEPLIAFENEYALAHAGFSVVATVDRFRDAQHVIETEGDIHLLVADIRLRGARSGVELARHARGRDVAVLFATARCPEEARTADLALGWLAKPFAARDLVRSIAVCDRLLQGLAPGRAPAALTLFPSA